MRVLVGWGDLEVCMDRYETSRPMGWDGEYLGEGLGLAEATDLVRVHRRPMHLSWCPEAEGQGLGYEWGCVVWPHPASEEVTSWTK